MADIPVPVRLAQARKQAIDVELRALGTVTAYNTVTVHTKVSGELVKVAFREGQYVKAGDLLAQVDPRPFQVALDQARGQLMQSQAQLANARRDLERYRTLFKQDSIAKQQLDTQAALVAQYEGTVKSNQASVDSAQLQLDYSHITAPQAGLTGLRQVDQGNLVATSDTNGVVVITQTDPISVIFTLPETQLPKVMAQVRLGKKLRVQVYDRGDTTLLSTGELETVDNQIDVTTGTVKLKARFANPDHALFPNQFVNVRLLVQTIDDATAIPSAAVQQGSAGAFVFATKDGKTVQVQQVQLGPVNGDWVQIEKGMEPGDQVVIEGADRLRTGAKIDVVIQDPSAAPANPSAQPASGNPNRRRRQQ